MKDQIGAEIQVAADSIKDVSSPIIETLKSYLTLNFALKAASALLVLAILWTVFRFARKISRAFVSRKFSAHAALMLDRFILYLFYIIAAMYVLGLAGINLSAVWGAAGVAGLAIGFAAQTSVSNVISGIFVIAEKSVHIGDTVTIDDVTGVVDAIDLISIKIHTFDNQYVRIPNSTVISTNLVNISYHPKRRFYMEVPVAYGTDLKFALETLEKAAALCPHAIADPAPSARIDSFGEGRVNMALALWCERDDYITLKNEAFVAAARVLGEAGIEIPHNRLYSDAPEITAERA